MNKKILGAGAAMAASLGMLLTPAAQAAPQEQGFSVEQGKIYDANGQEFIPQGVNLPYTWYQDEEASFADARAAGANTVRVVLSGQRWGTTTAAQVSHVIDLCKENQLVCILEDHDTTGYGEDAAALPLSSSVAYWKTLAPVLQGQEKYVMVNIGNEPYGNGDYSTWAADTIDAIDELRGAGISSTLIVDAPNWGQDWSSTMRQNAASVAATDDNLVFDIHMYGVFNTADSVKSYIDSFTSQNLAIMVGEFADFHASGIPDADTILSYTRDQGLGMLGWSWSGNGGHDAPLDMVEDFDPTKLTPWGERFINGADGLKERKPKVASVYTKSGTAPNGYPYCHNHSSDPDKDGWGWENNTSCVTRNGAADQGNRPSHAANGYPYCHDHSSDPDKDGWGWENNASCVTRNSAADK